MPDSTTAPALSNEEHAAIADRTDAERGSARSSTTLRALDRPSSEKPDDRYRVDILDRDEDPKSYPTWRKWLMVLTISTGTICATCASSIVRIHVKSNARIVGLIKTQSGFAEAGTSREFGVSHEVSILAGALFTAGLGVG